MNYIQKITRFTPGEMTSWEELQFHISRYSFAEPFARDKVVLDIACGSGHGSHYLSKKGAKMVIGGDISQDAIDYADDRFKSERIKFGLMDATKLPFADNYFDTIISMETIEHTSRYESFLSECKRVLKDGGTFMCSTPNREIISPGLKKPLHQPHMQEFSVTEFKSLLDRYFMDIIIYGIGHQSKQRVFMRRLKLMVELAIGGGKGKELMDSMISHTFSLLPSFRRVKVDSLQELDYEATLKEQYKPYRLLEMKNNLNLSTIAVCTARKSV